MKIKHRYSFVSKVACSRLRYSVAIAKGCIPEVGNKTGYTLITRLYQ